MPDMGRKGASHGRQRLTTHLSHNYNLADVFQNQVMCLF